MAEDMVVKEVRAQRSELLEQAGGTVEQLVNLLRRREAEAGRASISLPPRPPATQTRAG